MQPKTENEKRFLETLEKIFNTYSEKNADYGDSFKKSLIKRGNVAAVTRIEDKMNRIDQFIDNENKPNYNPRVKEERFEDTILDAAGYFAMWYMELKHIKNMTDSDKAKVILGIKDSFDSLATEDFPVEEADESNQDKATPYQYEDNRYVYKSPLMPDIDDMPESHFKQYYNEELQGGR